MRFIPRMQGWFNIQNAINATGYGGVGVGNQMIISLNGDKACDKIQH